MNAACKLPGQRVCLSVRGQTGARGGPAGQHEHQARRAGRRQRGRRGRLCVHVAAVQPRLAAHVQPADPHGAHPQGGPGAAGARPCGGVPWPGRLARAAQARADGHRMCAPRVRPQRPWVHGWAAGARAPGPLPAARGPCALVRQGAELAGGLRFLSACPAQPGVPARSPRQRAAWLGRSCGARGRRSATAAAPARREPRRQQRGGGGLLRQLVHAARHAALRQGLHHREAAAARGVPGAPRRCVAAAAG